MNILSLPTPHTSCDWCAVSERRFNQSIGSGGFRVKLKRFESRKETLALEPGCLVWLPDAFLSLVGGGKPLHQRPGTSVHGSTRLPGPPPSRSALDAKIAEVVGDSKRKPKRSSAREVRLTFFVFLYRVQRNPQGVEGSEEGGGECPQGRGGAPATGGSSRGPEWCFGRS